MCSVGGRRGGRKGARIVLLAAREGGRVSREEAMDGGTYMDVAFSDPAIANLDLPFRTKEIETTRKAHLSLFHSLIFGITKLDSRTGK